jgi:peptidoglycan/LPS O-acetylase OafA/YrhL
MFGSSRGKSTPASRLAAIEGLRGIAAVGIVVLHAWIVSGRPTDLLSVAWWGPLRMAVPLFFVLSGYFAMGPWLRAALDGGEAPAARDLVVKRAARIFPVFWLTGLVALVVLAGTGSWAMPNAAQAVSYFAMLHDWVPAGAAGVLNPPTWTLPIEMSFALALPLFGWLMLTAGRATRASLFVVIASLWLLGVAYCVAFDLIEPSRAWARTLMLMLPSFAAGMGAAVLSYQRTISRRVAYTLQLGGAAVFIWYVAGPIAHLQSSLPFRDILPGLCFAAIVAGAAAHGPTAISGKTTTWLGGRSFGLYLWHYPVIFLLTEHIGWPGQLWGTLIALAVGLMLAELTWRYVESPVNTAIRTRLAD